MHSLTPSAPNTPLSAALSELDFINTRLLRMHTQLQSLPTHEIDQSPLTRELLNALDSVTHRFQSLLTKSHSATDANTHSESHDELTGLTQIRSLLLTKLSNLQSQHSNTPVHSVNSISDDIALVLSDLAHLDAELVKLRSTELASKANREFTFDLSHTPSVSDSSNQRNTPQWHTMHNHSTPASSFNASDRFTPASRISHSIAPISDEQFGSAQSMHSMSSHASLGRIDEGPPLSLSMLTDECSETSSDRSRHSIDHSQSFETQPDEVYKRLTFHDTIASHRKTANASFQSSLSMTPQSNQYSTQMQASLPRRDGLASLFDKLEMNVEPALENLQTAVTDCVAIETQPVTDTEVKSEQQAQPETASQEQSAHKQEAAIDQSSKTETVAQSAATSQSATRVKLSSESAQKQQKLQEQQRAQTSMQSRVRTALNTPSSAVDMSRTLDSLLLAQTAQSARKSKSARQSPVRPKSVLTARKYTTNASQRRASLSAAKTDSKKVSKTPAKPQWNDNSSLSTTPAPTVSLTLTRKRPSLPVQAIVKPSAPVPQLAETPAHVRQLINTPTSALTPLTNVNTNAKSVKPAAQPVQSSLAPAFETDASKPVEASVFATSAAASVTQSRILSSLPEATRDSIMQATAALIEAREVERLRRREILIRMQQRKLMDSQPLDETLLYNGDDDSNTSQDEEAVMPADTKPAANAPSKSSRPSSVTRQTAPFTPASVGQFSIGSSSTSQKRRIVLQKRTTQPTVKRALLSTSKTTVKVDETSLSHAVAASKINASNEQAKSSNDKQVKVESTVIQGDFKGTIMIDAEKENRDPRTGELTTDRVPSSSIGSGKRSMLKFVAGRQRLALAVRQDVAQMAEIVTNDADQVSVVRHRPMPLQLVQQANGQGQQSVFARNASGGIQVFEDTIEQRLPKQVEQKHVLMKAFAPTDKENHPMHKNDATVPLQTGSVNVRRVTRSMTGGKTQPSTTSIRA